MTNHWIDIRNADRILIIGSNAAENHPASMTWIHKAREDRKAQLIVVDPRVTRSAAKADLYAPIRSGTDIAFYGGMMNYIIDNDLYHKEYVVHYTNAANLIHADYKGPEDVDGLFSGFVDDDGDGYGCAHDAAPPLLRRGLLLLGLVLLYPLLPGLGGPLHCGGRLGRGARGWPGGCLHIRLRRFLRRRHLHPSSSCHWPLVKSRFRSRGARPGRPPRAASTGTAGLRDTHGNAFIWDHT